MDTRLRKLQRMVASGDVSARARLRATILRAAPARVDEHVVLDAQRDTGFIKQARITGVWRVRGMRIENDMELRMLLRRVEAGALTADDFSGEQPRNTLWLSVERVQACLVRVGAPELAVSCDHCGAEVGAPCRRPSGRLHGSPHVVRQESLWAMNVPQARPEAPSEPIVDVEELRSLRDRVAARSGVAILSRLHPEEGGPAELEDAEEPMHALPFWPGDEDDHDAPESLDELLSLGDEADTWGWSSRGDN